MDSTHVNQLYVYYGIFSQIEPFHTQAVRVLLRELDFPGHSPIKVNAVNYSLDDVLSPDPDQIIIINILDESADNTFYVGESIELEIDQILDKIGNPVLDDLNVEWLGQYSNRSLILPFSTRPWTSKTSARASFNLEQPGPITFTATIEDNESEITIDVLQVIEPTETTAPPPYYTRSCDIKSYNNSNTNYTTKNNLRSYPNTVPVSNTHINCWKKNG